MFLRRTVFEKLIKGEASLTRGQGAGSGRCLRRPLGAGSIPPSYLPSEGQEVQGKGAVCL